MPWPPDGARGLDLAAKLGFPVPHFDGQRLLLRYRRRSNGVHQALRRAFAFFLCFFLFVFDSDGLAAADRAKSELTAANQRVEKELSQARNETASRLADADRRAQAIVEEAKARATEEGNKIVAAARAEAEQQTVQARESLREQVAALAVKGAEQILRKEVNAGVHADLLNRLKTEL